MYNDNKTETVELTRKEFDLAAIDGRIRGLKGTITHYEAAVASEAHIKKIGQKFTSRGVVYPIDYDAINAELARMEAARKDVMKRAN